MVGPKMQAFCPRIDILKGNRCILKIHKAPDCQKVPKSYVQSEFSVSKINGIFSKKKSFKNINLGDHFLKKTFFSNSNFWTTLFSKTMPNVWQTGISHRIFFNKIPFSTLILGQKSCILDPTIFKIPQPNWYYWIWLCSHQYRTFSLKSLIILLIFLKGYVISLG